MPTFRANSEYFGRMCRLFMTHSPPRRERWSTVCRAVARLVFQPRAFAGIERLGRDEPSRVAHYRDLVRRYYDHVTDIYLLRWGDCFHFAPFLTSVSLAEAQQGLHERLLCAAGLQPGLRALDIGCGVGGPAISIAAKSGAHVTGVNIHPGQVESAKRRAAANGLIHQTAFVVGDATELPFQDHEFDAVYSLEAICHIPHKERLFSEVRRVLKPGGVFTGTDWGVARPPETDEERGFVETICRLHAIPYLPSFERVAELLTTCGFRVEELQDLGAIPARIPWWDPLARSLESSVFGGLGSVSRLREGGRALVSAAQAELFSPMCFWKAHAGPDAENGTARSRHGGLP